MTIWQPSLSDQGPLYRALADAIAGDIQASILKPGDRLPTHRDLADALGVTIGTVTRGYAEAERRGLTHAVVGRGTFVSDQKASQDPWPNESDAEPGVVDLTISLPVSIPEEGEALANTLTEVARDPKIGDLLIYAPDSATLAQKQVFADWLTQMGLEVAPENLLITAGSQHALNVVLSTAFRAGQVMLAGELVYPSLKSQARIYGVTLRSLAMDAEGICPDALLAACAEDPKPHGLYLDPTLQNPTSAIMSQERRKAIAKISEAHNLLVLEDDVNGFLLPQPQTPIAAIIPERTFYLASVAKCIAPGLRTGALLPPKAFFRHLLTGIHTSMWMPPPLMVEVTARWLSDGTATRIIAAKRLETARRQKLAERILGQYPMLRHPLGYQIWLELPEPWAADSFVTAAMERDVKLIGASAFALSRRDVPHAVRLTLGRPSYADLERGLQTLDRLLAQEMTPAY